MLRAPDLRLPVRDVVALPGVTVGPEVTELIERLEAADCLVVASPTFKATYTGLLKLFLDQFGAGELGQVTTFPLMLGGSYTHALAPELTLRPVLVEIGASCPAPSLCSRSGATAGSTPPGRLLSARCATSRWA